MAIDKYKSCKDCPDRCVGCHSTCEGYISRCEERKDFLQKQRESRWVPTDHHIKASLNTLKKQKKLIGYKR